MLGLTTILRPIFHNRVKVCSRFASEGYDMQLQGLASLLKEASATEYGRKYGFKDISTYRQYQNNVPLVHYEDVRTLIMRMVEGEKDVLWKGRVRNFAQSSGTSDGKSKYIPITQAGFQRCHYRGSMDAVAHYLEMNPNSRIFDGKSFILGGSFANELHPNSGATIGDLSANLIEKINPFANLLRIPKKQVALMEDWSKKLPALVEACRKQNVVSLSGVPSWFLTVLKEVMRKEKAQSIHEVWPNLEVFFHGGISFKPYREQYMAITDSQKMHFLETYNASEGFFAAQTSWDTNAMLLLLDTGVFYEFIPLKEADKEQPEAICLRDVQRGKTYEMVISSCNGLWRYRLGDTVRIEQTNPVKISIAGRTKHYINAFGEELMVYNADEALELACKECNASVANYTAAPVYATQTSKGRHEWLIEFSQQPSDIEHFADRLDYHLQKANSDYEAKRFEGIFIDRLSITVARKGLFDDWLLKWSGRLGGQRKIPRLYNNRSIIDEMLKLNH